MDTPPTRDAGPSSNCIPGDEDEAADLPLPPIAERLAYLRPSRELLEFYRQKVAQFDGEHDDLLQMLERYRSTTEDQHKVQWEVQQREGEIAELQKALSDMQVYLFQEREQALRLYAENDRLKIRELDDRKKIQHLLALVGPDTGEITYFHREPPNQVTVPQVKVQPRPQDQWKVTKTRAAKEVSRKPSRTGSQDAEQYKKDNKTLLLQVEALQAQMEEQTRLAKEQVECLQEDRRIRVEEADVQRQRDQERLTALTDKLQRTQTLLYESTRDFLQLKFSSRSQEKGWMMEKDRLLRDLDGCHERLRSGRGGLEAVGPATAPQRLAQDHDHHDAPALSKKMYQEEIRALSEELKQAHKLADMYREQCVTLETELSQIREEGDVGKEMFQERSDRMAKRLQMMTQRYEALEKRREMEVEGFKSDVKHLRQKLKDVEKQLFKVRLLEKQMFKVDLADISNLSVLPPQDGTPGVTLNVGPNQDLAILHEVKQSNARTKKVQDELKTLKAKIYGLENELRYC